MLHVKPVVKLIDYSKNPFNLSIATARTCYSSKGILLPEDMDSSEKSIEIRDKVAKSTKKAGHLTTRQHPQFIFTIDKVSRQFVWSFLHSHPFYNSEQVSQRYVEVKKENYYIPANLNEKESALYLDAVNYSSESYFTFIELLKPYITDEYFSLFKARADYPEKWQLPIKKKCLEVARYLLPLATYTYLFHTVNGLTLHRYNRLMNTFDVPEEQRLVVEQMFEAVKEVDPLYTNEMDDPIPLEETTEYKFFESMYGSKSSYNPTQAKEFIEEFDFDLNGRYSKLVGFSNQTLDILANSVRAVLGATKKNVSNEKAIELLLSPKENSHLTSTLNETTMSPISRAMFHANYTFKKKISHTADSQDQRHRMVPGSRPVLLAQYAGEPDYITPEIIKKYPKLNEEYSNRMNTLFKKINSFLEVATVKENATYLFPNAFPIRFYESGDLLNLHHKWKSRLCYNAQEEIFFASKNEVSDLNEIQPEIAKWIKAPCGIRKLGEQKPYCPEGDKFCGVQVWKIDLPEYNRTI
jgi:thymidylate synthase ThyX